MKVKLLLALLVVFVSGIIIGYEGGKFIMHSRVKKMIKGGPELIQQHLVEKLTEKLSLTPEQIPPVREKIRQGVEQMDEIRKQQHAQFEKQVNENIQSIAPLLTAQQQKILVKITPEDLRPRRMPPMPNGKMPPPAPGGPPPDGAKPSPHEMK